MQPVEMCQVQELYDSDARRVHWRIGQGAGARVAQEGRRSQRDGEGTGEKPEAIIEFIPPFLIAKMFQINLGIGRTLNLSKQFPEI